MSVLGTHIKKLASQAPAEPEKSSPDTPAFTKEAMDKLADVGVAYAKEYLDAMTKVAAMTDEQLAKYAEAVELGKTIAHAQFEEMLKIAANMEASPDGAGAEQDGQEMPPQEGQVGMEGGAPPEHVQQAIAQIAHAAAEHLANSMDPAELEDPAVHEHIINLASSIAHDAVMSGAADEAVGGQPEGGQ